MKDPAVCWGRRCFVSCRYDRPSHQEMPSQEEVRAKPQNQGGSRREDMGKSLWGRMGETEPAG